MYPITAAHAARHVRPSVCANAAFTHGAIVSARQTFLKSPSTNSVTPADRFVQFTWNVSSATNCGIIFLWLMIGPAMRCGKIVTNSPYASSEGVLACPRYASTRYAVCVNVKNEMPSGSTICGKSNTIAPASAFHVPRKKSVYLKYPSSATLARVPNASQAFRAR